MRFVSFFAGIGGFDLGFQQAGLEPVFHCEIDEHCQRVLKRHWPDVPLHGDIMTLPNEDIPHADLWAAGWPCQDLSHANTNRTGLKGKRSGLFYRFADLLREAQPKWIVLENVLGVLSAEKGEALESVVNELEEIGYLGGWFTSNALHAGLPQNRSRVFFIGTFRSESAFKFFSYCSELYGDSQKRGQEQSNAGSVLRKKPNGNNPLVVQRRGGFGYTKATDFCPTLRAQTGKHQGGHSDRPILCCEKFDVGRVRSRNGLPKRMDGRRGRLIGNAVAPPVAKWIGDIILQVEKNEQMD